MTRDRSWTGYWQAVLLFTLFLNLVSLIQVYDKAGGQTGDSQSLRLQLILILLSIGILIELVLLFFSWFGPPRVLVLIYSWVGYVLERLGRINWLVFIGIIATWALFFFSPIGKTVYYSGLQWLSWWVLSLLGVVFLQSSGIKLGPGRIMVVSTLTATIVYYLVSMVLRISPLPFTLSWSETSQYYDASLFFARRIYGTALNWPVLYPSQKILLSVPFIFSQPPIWVIRIWQVVLAVGLNIASTVLFVRYLQINDRFTRVIVLALVFLIFLQTYYYLHIAIILVLLGWHPRKWGRVMLFVLLASAWVGISRINWFPVPAMIAATLYFLTCEVKRQSIVGYLKYPVLWGVSGLVAAVLSQVLYINLSGNDAIFFSSSFSSELLWYRLLPNVTNPLGILMGSFLVTLPFAGLLFLKVDGHWKVFHPIRWAGIAGMLLVLLIGGMVVSVKIGGGDNLHNLDAYLVLVTVITGSIFFDRNEPDEPEGVSRRIIKIPDAWLLKASLFLMILSLGYLTLQYGGSFFITKLRAAPQALRTISVHSQQKVSEGGEVLFMADRQLLTFQDIQGVPLVPEYERVFLMEMAMAGNQEYLERFHEDISQQRFSLIVSEPLNKLLKGRDFPFGEENDVWIKDVSEVVLCYYQPVETMREVQLQLLEPVDDPDTCKK